MASTGKLCGLGGRSQISSIMKILNADAPDSRTVWKFGETAAVEQNYNTGREHAWPIFGAYSDERGSNAIPLVLEHSSIPCLTCRRR